MYKEHYISELKTRLNELRLSESISKRYLDYAHRLLDNNLPVIYDLDHLARLMGLASEDIAGVMINEDSFYSEMQIPKKSGGSRRLDIPSVKLKYMQRWILDNILYNIPISEYAHGFCKGKSILTNAKLHLGADCVVNTDLKDFFPSISLDMVHRVFHYFGYTKDIAFILAKICTYNNKLPQGSPASPYLSNIVCLRLDKRISKLAQAYGGSYSRYADDITLSGSNSIQKCISTLVDILQEEGFAVNTSKTRMSYKYQRQDVTGLIVNDGYVRVNKRYKKSVMQEIYYCGKYGVDDHLRKIGCDKSFYKEHLYGKVYFIKMVEPAVGSLLLDKLSNINWSY